MPTPLIRCAAAAFMLLASLAAQAASSSSASSMPRPPEGGRPPGPPPEAVSACQGKTEGAKASFKGRNGETVEGTCRSIDGKLAVVPANMPAPGDRPPPPR
ncbi:hypothetical protein [Viridibacterium curvum]|uniref:Uncharacterized protein n=1 Tax=Viridibacterium curvum TaxID=1101404 RepID=A0ABP9QSZ1_9RHOO